MVVRSVSVKLMISLAVGTSRQHTREEAPKPRTSESHKVDPYTNPGTGERTMMNGFGNSVTKQDDGATGLGRNDTGDSDHMDGLESTKTLTNDDTRRLHGGSFGQPFSADDLVHAMTHSTLRASAVQA